MSIATLKKMSSASNIDALNQKIKSLMDPKANKDERFWQPTVDKAGNGYAVIRFLPNPDDEEIVPLPFVRVYDHGFKGPGGWYIENSRTTLGKEEADPVMESNSILWNEGGKEGKAIVSGTDENPGRKRRLHFYSNILVLEDPGNPANVGKVFLYKYGKKIYEKINNMMEPKFPDQPKINPFDPVKGANFILRIQRVDGQRNYNESSFAPVSSIDKKYDHLEPYALFEFIDPKNFKSYDELKAKLDRVLGAGRKPKTQTVEHDEEVPQSFVSKTSKASPVADADEPPFDVDDEEGDADGELEKFRRLASQ